MQRRSYSLCQLLFSASFFAAGIFAASLSLTACAHSAPRQVAQSYPESWWTYVDPKGAPAWEILPQIASKEKGEVIVSKRNELGVLSNLAATPFVFHEKNYASVEGLWQAMKFPESEADERWSTLVKWPMTRAQVMLLSGFEAKDAGKIANDNMKILGIKWLTFNGIKIDYNGADKQKYYEIILAAMKEKLSQNPPVKEVLLKTGNLRLLPDHNQGPAPAAAYLYCDIWMKLRKELQTKSNL